MKITVSRYKRNKDFYIVDGGRRTWKPVLVLSKIRANAIANARRRLMAKRK